MKKVYRMLLWLVTIAVGVFLALSFYLYLNQRNMVFFPAKEFIGTPDRMGLKYEDVYIAVTDDQKVHAWYFPPPDSGTAKVVLFCHGNAGNISHRLETAEFLVELGAGMLLFDYRGYGQSDGQPDEENCYADARACYDWLIGEKRFQPQEIVFFGRSLGGAVAVDLAAKVPCGGLIVESSFTSAGDLGQKVFPVFPVKLILKYKFDSIDKIDRVHCPLLVTHSPADDIVPYSMGRQLFEKAGQPKQFVDLFGGHNDREYLTDPAYREAVRKLIWPGM